ncbi:Sec-independent protein translocase subunit TatA [Nakamurella antarctica]|uniref:Sec-independent protein translocase protein TatA n=1 Tax=Nakamurella antarctica TaxID=1902245 RepID=A0A3G8ZKB8_9ACTN|nr:Sec-independent protein translocase subunit TatA [Nakamurella antarctica]AZI57650.1 Sec-independent protein translocase subunit TatA [Nakamurella antarctica]
MGALAWWHWAIILILFVLLFGAKKLPDAARGVGRSLRILKAEVGAMSEDKKDDPASAVVIAPPAATGMSAAQLSPNAVEPIEPAQPLHSAQITINGRPLDQN